MILIKQILIRFFFFFKILLIELKLIHNQSFKIIVNPMTIKSSQLKPIFTSKIEVARNSRVKQFYLWSGNNVVVQSKYGLSTFKEFIFLYPYDQPIIYYKKRLNKLLQYDSFYLRYFKTPKQINLTSAILASTSAGNVNYYHLLIELVPKILFVYDKSNGYDWIIVNGPVKPFLLDVFEALNLRHKLIIMNNRVSYKVSDLLIPGPLAGMARPTKLQVNLLRKYFLDNSFNNKLNSKIYVSRTGSKSRRVINEKDIELMFIEMGYSIIMSDSLSFYEQVKIFSSAKIVVGFHGAGLTNIIFQSKQKFVIELFPHQEVVNSLFKSLSKLNSLKYKKIILKSKIVKKNTYHVHLDSLNKYRSNF